MEVAKKREVKWEPIAAGLSGWIGEEKITKDDGTKVTIKKSTGPLGLIETVDKVIVEKDK